MIRSVPRPVGETGTLTNRKKYRAMRAHQASGATMFLTEIQQI